MRIDVDFWHFLPYRYIWSLLSSKKLHFRNVGRHSESNIVLVDGKCFSADKIGYFSFTNDIEAIHNRYFWRTYADDGFGVAVGFRSGGFRRDSGPIASGDRALAIQSAGRPITNLYIPSKEEGKIVKCYHAMVFYEDQPDVASPGLPQPTSDDLKDFGNLCFTYKPESDSPDKEERLILLDCPTSREIDFSTMRPSLYPKCIAIGYDLPKHFQESIHEVYGASYLLYETEMDWRAEAIAIGTIGW